MKALIIIISFTIVSFANVFDAKTFKAEFKQTITNNSQKEIIYKGNLFLKNNGNILWQYKEPLIKNVYITDGGIIIDEPELEQAIVSNIDESLNLITILKESKKIDELTYENTINDIKYTIKTYQDVLNSIFYTDNIGNKIKIVFSNSIVDENIPDKLFEFHAPENYDIIRK